MKWKHSRGGSVIWFLWWVGCSFFGGVMGASSAMGSAKERRQQQTTHQWKQWSWKPQIVNEENERERRQINLWNEFIHETNDCRCLSLLNERNANFNQLINHLSFLFEEMNVWLIEDWLGAPAATLNFIFNFEKKQANSIHSSIKFNWKWIWIDWMSLNLTGVLRNAERDEPTIHLFHWMEGPNPIHSIGVDEFKKTLIKIKLINVKWNE